MSGADLIEIRHKAQDIDVLWRNTAPMPAAGSYEDHSLNLLAVYDAERRLTGLVVNVPCPSQISESKFVVSADYWHETRIELRRRFGEHLFILPNAVRPAIGAPGLSMTEMRTIACWS